MRDCKLKEINTIYYVLFPFLFLLHAALNRNSKCNLVHLTSFLVHNHQL